MSARLSFVLVSVLSLGCGDDGGTPMVDAPVVVPSIVAVDPCPGTVATTITTLATAFDMPTFTTTQGMVIKFVSTSTHPIGAIAPTEATLAVPEGQTKCFRFTMPGMFRYKCNVHGYAGTITVN